MIAKTDITYTNKQYLLFDRKATGQTKVIKIKKTRNLWGQLNCTITQKWYAVVATRLFVWWEKETANYV